MWPKITSCRSWWTWAKMTGFRGQRGTRIQYFTLVTGVSQSEMLMWAEGQKKFSCFQICKKQWGIFVKIFPLCSFFLILQVLWGTCKMRELAALFYNDPTTSRDDYFFCRFIAVRAVFLTLSGLKTFLTVTCLWLVHCPLTNCNLLLDWIYLAYRGLK